VSFVQLKINPIFVCFAHISMPTKHKVANLSRNTSTYRSMQNTRVKRNEEQIQQQNNDERVSMAQLRQEQSEDTRAGRNK